MSRNYTHGRPLFRTDLSQRQLSCNIRGTSTLSIMESFYNFKATTCSSVHEFHDVLHDITSRGLGLDGYQRAYSRFIQDKNEKLEFEMEVPLTGTMAANIAAASKEAFEAVMLRSSILNESLSTTQREIRQATPDTVISEIPYFPDITLRCPACEVYIKIEKLNYHRTYHKALLTMKYGKTHKPDSVEALQKRRKVLLKRAFSKREVLHQVTSVGETLDPKVVQKINDAYELLKVDLEDTHESLRTVQEPVNLEVEGHTLECSLKCVAAVGICANDNSRWKSTMEDTRVFQDHFGNDPKKCFLAIYDGHHGKFAADITANELHHALLREMAKFDANTNCTCTFNMADNVDISQYPISHHLLPKGPVEKRLVHKESSNDIRQVIHTCGESGTIYESDMIDVDLEKIEIKETEKYDRKTPKSPKSPKDIIKNKFAENLQLAFKKSYYKIDRLLFYGKNEHSRVRWSGCSAVTVVLEDEKENNNMIPEVEELKRDIENENKSRTESKNERPTSVEEPQRIGVIHIANAGNCQAVLVRANHAYRITKDHSLYNEKEKARITRQGGCVSESEKQLRVNGLLAATRGLGNHGDPKLKALITNEPHTIAVPIDQYAQFLIIASNGLWEIFSPEEVGLLVSQMLPCNQVPPPRHISTSMNLLIAQYNTYRQAQSSTPNSREQQFESAISHPSVYSDPTQTPNMLSTLNPDVLIGDEDWDRRSLSARSIRHISSHKGQPLEESVDDNLRTNENKIDQSFKILETIESSRTGTDLQTSLSDTALKINNNERSDNSVTPHRSGTASRLSRSDQELADILPSESKLEIKSSLKSADSKRRTDSNRRLSFADAPQFDYSVKDHNVIVHVQVDSVDDDSDSEIDGIGSGDESGNEGDIDTYADVLSVPPSPGSSLNVLTTEQIQRDFAKAMSERLVQAALLAGARDNITCMVVLFPGSGIV